MEIRSIGALPAAAHADCYLQTMQQTCAAASIQSGENIVVSEKRETIQLNESKPSQKEETSNHLCGRSFYFRVVKKSYQMFSRVFQCSARVFNL